LGLQDGARAARLRPGALQTRQNPAPRLGRRGRDPPRHAASFGGGTQHPRLQLHGAHAAPPPVAERQLLRLGPLRAPDPRAQAPTCVEGCASERARRPSRLHRGLQRRDPPLPARRHLLASCATRRFVGGPRPRPGADATAEAAARAPGGVDLELNPYLPAHPEDGVQDAEPYARGQAARVAPTPYLHKNRLDWHDHGVLQRGRRENHEAGRSNLLDQRPLQL